MADYSTYTRKTTTHVVELKTPSNITELDKALHSITNAYETVHLKPLLSDDAIRVVTTEDSIRLEFDIIE